MDATAIDSGAPDTGTERVTSQPCSVTTSDAAGTNYTAPPPTGEIPLSGGTSSLARISLYANVDAGFASPPLEIALPSLTAGTQPLVMRFAIEENSPTILFSDVGSTSNCSGDLCNQYAWGTAGGGTVTIADLTATTFHLTVSGALMKPLGGANDGGTNLGTGATGSFTLDVDCPLVAR